MKADSYNLILYELFLQTGRFPSEIKREFGLRHIRELALSVEIMREQRAIQELPQQTQAQLRETRRLL